MKLDSLWNKLHSYTADELEAYALSHHVEGMTQEFDSQAHAADYVCAQLGIDKPEEAEEAGTKLDELAREHQNKHPNLSIEACLGIVRKANPELTRRFAEHSFGAIKGTGRLASS
jgi:hypothetical protein